MINGIQQPALAESELRESFDVRWQGFASEIEEIRKKPTANSVPKKRSQEELLEEVLTQIRTLSASLIVNPLQATPTTSEITHVVSEGNREEATYVWNLLLEEIQKERALLRSFAQAAIPLSVTGSRLMLGFKKDATLARDTLAKEKNKSYLEELLKNMGYKQSLVFVTLP